MEPRKDGRMDARQDGTREEWNLEPRKIGALEGWNQVNMEPKKNGTRKEMESSKKWNP